MPSKDIISGIILILFSMFCIYHNDGNRWTLNDGRTVDLLVKVRDGEVEDDDT